MQVRLAIFGSHNAREVAILRLLSRELHVNMRRPSTVFFLITQRSDFGTALEHIANRPVLNACPTQVPIKHPKSLHITNGFPSNFLWHGEGVLCDEGWAIRAVLAVDGYTSDFTGGEGEHRCTGGCTQIEANMMIAHASKKFRRVHFRTTLVVPPHRIEVGCGPCLTGWTSEVVNPIGCVKHHRRVKPGVPHEGHDEPRRSILLEVSAKHESMPAMRRFMLGSAVVLLAPTVLPGWALASVLDGSGDRLRKGLLAPALGLLLLYGLNGALLLLGIWSSAVVWVSILAMNIVAYRLVNIRHEVLAKRSRWQLLEAAMHGELSEETDTPSLSKEAEVQLLFRERRSMPLFALGIAIATTALLTPMIQRLPFGVDWIGFAMLTQQMMVEGRLALSGTNEGFWTYPPAFPSVAGWLGATTGVHAGLAVFHLGHYTLFVLLLGMMGALDRHGAGGHAMLAMGLGLGLFAKTFDSGYPSVASQLGIVVGVLVLFRPVEQRQKHHTLALCMALVSVAMIHPTGAIYLALLMLSHILHGIHLESEEHKALMQRFAYVTSAFITVGFALALVVIAPRFSMRRCSRNTGGKAESRCWSTTVRCWLLVPSLRFPFAKPSKGALQSRGSPCFGCSVSFTLLKVSNTSRSSPPLVHALFDGPPCIPPSVGDTCGLVVVNGHGTYPARLRGTQPHGTYRNRSAWQCWCRFFLALSPHKALP